MKYPHVINALYGHPWAITPAGWHAAHSVFLRHISGQLAAPQLPKSKRPLTDWSGSPIDQLSIEDGIAILPIKGTLINGAGLLEKSCGVVSHQDIHDDLDTALASAGLRGIVLDFDCPGGTVNGTPELSERIASIPSKIRTIAWTDSLMASAAYWVACGCREIYCAPSATVGSIGCIWETMNVVDQLAAEGIEVDVFTSGPFKGMGHPAKRITDEQRAWIQSTVDSIAAQFKQDVCTARELSTGENMQGQCFTGLECVENGLADDCQLRLADLLQRLHTP